MQSLQHLHTFGLSATSKSFLELKSEEQLPSVYRRLAEENWFLLGEGSNTVFTQDYLGTVLRLNTKGIEVKERDTDYLLKVKAGENWHQLVIWCLEKGIRGFENLALIPGSVGAAPIQNIGAYGVEIERFVESIEYYDLSDAKFKVLNRQECQFAYRDSVFKHGLAGQAIITSVHFSMPKRWCPNQTYGDLSLLNNPSAQDIFNMVVSIRQSKLPDPVKIGNAGSFFKNPVIESSIWRDLKVQWEDLPGYGDGAGKTKVPAAWLIDTLGFKGVSLGGIRCHAKQPLVLTNTGNGTGQELLEMARRIKSAVLKEFAIELENEVRLMGNQGLIRL